MATWRDLRVEALTVAVRMILRAIARRSDWPSGVRPPLIAARDALSAGLTEEETLIRLRAQDAAMARALGQVR